MKSMLPEERLTRLLTAFLIILSVFSGGIASASQTKKPAPKKPAAKKPAPAKSTAKAKTPAKNPASKAVASNKAKTAAQKKAPQKKTPPKKMTAAQLRKEAARKKAEEQKRQAALAAQRRREQAAREARARKLAFERGLRSDTVANILKDNTEGEDLRIRRVAMNALGERAGTIVVMEAKTGRILTMVNQEWGVKHGFKPCSTIKLVTGVAGINENLISGDGSIIGDPMKLDLNDALAYSNNAYFQRIGVKMGTETMIDYAKKMGLGQKTGVNADGEFPGKLPYGNKNPRIYSHADDFEVTPLQLAVMVTALTNGGTRVTPQFNNVRTEKAALRLGAGKEMPFAGEVRRGVIPGMIGAAEYGTARRGVDSS
ncbi:MAG TPA: penicillin-binding transpeptidase domain-containing protein, partial [Pyrinomonadaceae bacterium]|nr:penicillin-binding transpeptidase domain-containing protein [Pyrinomonadaceae bacterium]